MRLRDWPDSCRAAPNTVFVELRRGDLDAFAVYQAHCGNTCAKVRNHDPAHWPDHLAPAEALREAHSLALADLVARVPDGACACACVNGAAFHTLGVLRLVRRDVDVAARLDEAFDAVGFVRAGRCAQA